MLKKFRSLAGLSVIDQSLVSGINFATGIYLAYTLGIADFGRYSLILLIVQFCIEIQRSVITSPIFIFAAEKDNAGYLASLYPVQIVFAFILTIVGAGFIYASGFWFEKWQIAPFVLPAAFYILTRLQQEFYRRYFFATQDGKKTLGIDLIYALIMITGFIAFSRNMSTQIALWLGTAASIIPLFFYKIKFSFSRKVIQATTRKHYNFGKWLFISSLANYLSSNLLLFIGSAMIGSAAAGMMKIGQYIMGGMIILYQAIDNVVPYKLSKFVQNRQFPALKVNYKKYLQIVFLATALHAIIVYHLIGPILRQINGGAYDNVQYQIAVGYILFTFLLTASYSLQYLLRAFQKTKPIFMASFISALIVIASGNWLITRYEIMGILYGFFLSQTIMLTIYLFHSIRLLRAVS